MSLWSRHELSIFLCPERVALQRTERRLTPRGYARIVRARTVSHCQNPTTGQTPWRGSLDTLATLLPAFIYRDMHASVILSDKFMHYALIPWYDNLSDAEDLVMARHRFAEMRGDSADSLSIRVSPGPAGAASLAAAVEQDLLGDLGQVMEPAKVHLASIRPHLMVAYNSCRAGLEHCSAWIALLEPNCLCLAVLKNGRFTWIRKVSIGDTWREEFPDILERESYLADTDVQLNEVIMWAPHLADDEMPATGRWRLRRMIPQHAFWRETQTPEMEA